MFQSQTPAILDLMIDPDALRLPKAPIIEAVLDLDCDLPTDLNFATLEHPARDRLRDRYPKVRPQFLQEHHIEVKGNEPPKMSVRQALKAFQFLHNDEKQIVQVRPQGYSFNRLAPYSSLDDYLPEIERTWKLYAELTSVLQIKVVRLRYINRILLPMVANKVDLDEYIKASPRSPDEERLMLISYLNQYVAVEKDTPHQVNVVSTSQAPEDDKLPIILDISVASTKITEPNNWATISDTIQSLRLLKNRIFINSLTERCFKLFQ